MALRSSGTGSGQAGRRSSSGTCSMKNVSTARFALSIPKVKMGGKLSPASSLEMSVKNGPHTTTSWSFVRNTPVKNFKPLVSIRLAYSPSSSAARSSEATGYPSSIEIALRMNGESSIVRWTTQWPCSGIQPNLLGVCVLPTVASTQSTRRLISLLTSLGGKRWPLQDGLTLLATLKQALLQGQGGRLRFNGFLVLHQAIPMSLSSV